MKTYRIIEVILLINLGLKEQKHYPLDRRGELLHCQKQGSIREPNPPKVLQAQEIFLLCATTEHV
jgi:hypothetical protein